MTDERSNRQVIEQAADEWLNSPEPGSEAKAIEVALAAAGRLVTPEHDAQERENSYNAGYAAGYEKAAEIIKAMGATS